jgi:hypothetical protein
VRSFLGLVARRGKEGKGKGKGSEGGPGREARESRSLFGGGGEFVEV